MKQHEEQYNLRSPEPRKICAIQESGLRRPVSQSINHTNNVMNSIDLSGLGEEEKSFLNKVFLFNAKLRFT